MPNIKSQKKRVLTNNKRNLAVSAKKTALRTSIKKTVVAIEAGNKEQAIVCFNEASSKLDQAVCKNIVKANYASRQKARLSKAINAMA